MNDKELQRVIELSQEIVALRTRLHAAEAELLGVVGGAPAPTPPVPKKSSTVPDSPVRRRGGGKRSKVFHRTAPGAFQTAVLEVFERNPLKIYSNRDVAAELGILRHHGERNRLNAQLWAFWQRGLLEKVDKGRYASAKTKPGETRNGASHGSDLEATRQAVSANKSSSPIPLRAS
jgi:hypothetical protein